MTKILIIRSRHTCKDSGTGLLCLCGQPSRNACAQLAATPCLPRTDPCFAPPLSLQQAMQAKEDEVYELKQACEDLQDDIASCEKKERELLSFSEKLASSNAELQTSKTSLEKKVTTLCLSVDF